MEEHYFATAERPAPVAFASVDPVFALPHLSVEIHHEQAFVDD
jgi:hypothetical protein